MTLIDGRNIDRSLIRFESANMRFYLGGEDVTNQVRRADKLTFSGFDVDADDRRLSLEKYSGVQIAEIPGELSASTASFFLKQIVTEPLDAPLESLSNQAKKVFSNFGVWSILIALGIGLFLWMGGLSLLKGTLKKP